ncbi:MAG: two-component system, OmpR family, response regulator [Candidatus Saccharibacteria bacterium]|nr:two-component system, OmpR family, response regulator [Candidatus Saccharibacteria bacterium]
MNILLIEPDRLLAGTYRQALEGQGHKVIMCASAQSAIFAADTVTPDLIILELQLIDHSGIEFLYEFRSYPEWQNIPVVVQSTVPAREFDNSWDLLKNELGVAGYHYKPLTTLQTLLNSVNSFAPA